MIHAKIIEDSVSVKANRLTTFQLIYPRFIHSELMTHRVFSRNASSSRAIPVKKMIDMVRNNPAMPIHWGKNQPGMQANEQLTGLELLQAKELWLTAAENAAWVAEKMNSIGLHKQVANRILEPFQHISVVLTATEFDNWFDLRAHEDAQPEIHELALQMLSVMKESAPKLMLPGDWHLPYVTDTDWEFLVDSYGEDINAQIEMATKISAARCCRVSYLKHDGSTASVQEDIDLCEKLAGAVPIHASPFEHQATPDEFRKEAKFGGYDGWEQQELHGNFVGWVQNRKLLEKSFSNSTSITAYSVTTE